MHFQKPERVFVIKQETIVLGSANQSFFFSLACYAGERDKLEVGT